MKNNIVFIIALLILMFGTKVEKSCSFQSQTMVLSPEQGYFNAYIVIPVRATEIERCAAEELRTYIRRITGGEIAVVKETASLENFGFFIGRTLMSKPYSLPVVSPYEGANGFRIKSIPNGLVFIGGDDLSTLYAVYAFLEEYQGCGWFLPLELGEIVPRNRGVIIPTTIDVTQVPDIPVRWIGSGAWGLKNKMNAKVQINGHDVGTINQWSYHTFGIIMPKEKYYDDHPEYYTLFNINTLRGTDLKQPQKGNVRFSTQELRGWQLCVSNPELIRFVTNILIETLERNPDAQFIYVTPNDGAGYCQCSRCRAQVEPNRVNDPFAHETGPIFIFNNEVARRIEKYCPGKFVKVGAYHVYSRYPLDPSFKLKDNLAVQVCHYDFCFNHPIADQTCTYNADFNREFSKWAKNTNHLHIYEYSCLHSWANLIWPMVHCLRKDMPEYHHRGVELYYTQSGYLSQCYALNYYVASKLAWDSSLNVDELITDFCKKCYGTAAPAMERYHRFIEDSWEKNGLHVSYAVEPVPVSVCKFFPPSMIAEADHYLRDAETVTVDSLSKERIHFARAELDYLRLVLNYLNAISEPFKGVNPDDTRAIENAKVRAASIGNTIAPTIEKYFKENFPERLMRGWSMTGVEGLLLTHTRPNRIPGNWHGK